MEYTVQKREKSHVAFIVTLDNKEWSDCQKGAFVAYSRKFKIDGFRPGKAPFELFVKRFGIETINEYAVEFAYKKYYEKIINEVGYSQSNTDGIVIMLSYSPLVELISVDENCAKFSIEALHYPNIKLANYKGEILETEKPVVSDEDVQEEIKYDLDKVSRVIEISGPAELNDEIGYIQAFEDTVTAPDGETKIEVVTHEGVDKLDNIILTNRYENKSLNTLCNDTLGKNVGDIVTWYNKSNDGEKKHLLKICEIKRKELPAQDDEFAKDVSEFDTFEEYKADVKEKLLKKKEKENQHNALKKFMGKIIETSEVEIPDEFVKFDFDARIQELKDRFNKTNSSRSGEKFTISNEMKDRCFEQSKASVRAFLVTSELLERMESEEGKFDEKIEKKFETESPEWWAMVKGQLKDATERRRRELMRELKMGMVTEYLGTYNEYKEIESPKEEV
ncbi:MAG: hypothetical protein LBU04_05520 [Christensenellaceae bacterium]|jgi:trigger factor|nr:hypothetical protein [Christensenellaceae bacterium]